MEDSEPDISRNRKGNGRTMGNDMTVKSQPELDFIEASKNRPREIVTDSSEEFQAICRRADKGEFFIEAIEVGKSPAQWVCFIQWP